MKEKKKKKEAQNKLDAKIVLGPPRKLKSQCVCQNIDLYLQQRRKGVGIISLPLPFKAQETSRGEIHSVGFLEPRVVLN